MIQRYGKQKKLKRENVSSFRAPISSLNPDLESIKEINQRFTYLTNPKPSLL